MSGDRDATDALRPIWWDAEAVGYVDQRRLPHEVVRRRAASVDEVVDALATLAVRGAPCIGAFGAFGVALARALHTDEVSYDAAVARIRAARPTAVNLAWAVDRVVAAEGRELEEAHAVLNETRKADAAIARHGAALLPARGGVITHCNTGPLATGGDGTALGVLIAAHRAGKRIHVYVDETRPLLQGARLTMLELQAAGVPATLIVDGAAAAIIGLRGVACALVGADRIACNGDTANKVGTLGLALAAAHHGIPFYVAAPRSTIDFGLSTGDGIPIEQRSPDEVRSFGGVSVAPDGCDADNPAFDVTPGRLIAGIVTEYGVARPPYTESLPDLATRPLVAAIA